LFENDRLDDLSALIAQDKDSIQQFLEMKFDDLHFDKQEDEFDLDQQVPPIAKLGDIWKLGSHRLMCGDCTKKEDVDKLLNGVKVDLLLTDPPYGVDYSAKNEFLNEMDKGNRIQKDIENDALSKLGYRDFFTSFLKLIPFADYNIFYIFMLGFALHYLRLALDDCQLIWGDYLLWVKNNHVLGRKDYNAKHEFIVYGWKRHHKFYGGFNTTVLQYDKPLMSELHPVMKPIELLAKLIDDGSQKDMVVYDPFLGSGSTMIACEQKNRFCYGMEIDPHYCDVIIARWEKYTGKKAKHV
jgi:site-specific DNA-methyltransferase (adenine-specific)